MNLYIVKDTTKFSSEKVHTLQTFVVSKADTLNFCNEKAHTTTFCNDKKQTLLAFVVKKHTPYKPL